jgi:3-isopropylmalate/(R)-2-methylmalate dehydratase small subunit
MPSRIDRVSGRAIVLPGDDLDTDRIMPARFLKAVTFEGLEAHVFEDDRRAIKEQGSQHPFDDQSRAGARILITGANFGCGSSREHAPQGLSRWGLHAIVAESFAEIFAGNALMIGLACVSATAGDLELLRKRTQQNPALVCVVDLERQSLTAEDLTIAIHQPPAARAALLSGAWDTTGLLLEDYGDVERTASELPYIRGF